MSLTARVLRPAPRENKNIKGLGVKKTSASSTSAPSWSRKGTGSEGRKATGQSQMSKKCEESTGSKTNLKKFGC